MPKAKELSLEEKRIIEKLKNDGKSNIFIAKLLSRSKSAVGKYLKRRNDRGSETNKCRTGRPKSTTTRIDKRIRTIVDTNKRISLQGIKNQLELYVSKMTICRRIKDLGLAARAVRKIPYVSRANITKRMTFYQKHAMKDVNFWKTILWSDECKIEMKYHNGKMHVWRKPGEEFSYKCVEPTFKGQTRGVMIWGCMAAGGVGNIVTIEGNMNAQMYLEVLKQSVFQQGVKLIGPNFTFQHDNAPIHTAKIIKEYIKHTNMRVLEWPPQSPDLSPIENLWAHLKTKVAARKPRNVHDLREIIQEEWLLIEPSYCLKLVGSMTRRLCLLSSRSGGYIGH